ncbi:MAG: hypothetical protein QOE19_1057 [Actinomycetota bacterium]|jgi:hypothetical protein|nr:hypothetical protein [Actinomycetota bacterium]
MAGHIRWQADACRQLGSPLYSVLLDHVADDVLAGGPSADVLAGHENDPGPSALALRLMGSVHRLVLERCAPALAEFFPSVGGEAAAEEAWPALREVLVEHRGELRRLLALDQAPQTNEVGRAAALIGGLAHVVAEWPGPLRLFEIGASAGLNLRADKYRVALPGGLGLGPLDSPVVLDNAWQGRLPPLGAPLEIVERSGCDTAPLDATTDDGRLRLTSYVWPDQRARLDRLRGALEIAARVPATVDRATGRDFVRRIELVPGTTTVIWHSVTWQYLGVDEQEDVSARLDDLAAQADERSRFAHLLLEPRRRTPSSEWEFLLVLRIWPGGDERVLATAHPHGLPTTWS